MPLGAVPVLSWCGEVPVGGKQSSLYSATYPRPGMYPRVARPRAKSRTPAAPTVWARAARGAAHRPHAWTPGATCWPWPGPPMEKEMSQIHLD